MPVSVIDRELCADVVYSELDRIEFANFVRMVVSDPELRALFTVDAPAAIAQSGVTLSPFAAQILADNASRAAALTSDMDSVITSFFFFLIA
jgi:hypothetical protein